MPEFHWSMLLGVAGVVGLAVGPVLAMVGPKHLRRSFVLVLLPVSGLVVLVAVAMYVFVRPVEISSAERDEAVRGFLSAIRRDDQRAARTLTASGYEPDSAFLRDHVRNHERYEQGSSYITNTDDLSCVRGMLYPDRTKLIMKLVKERGSWRVLRASTTDPCEDDFRH